MIRTPETLHATYAGLFVEAVLAFGIFAMLIVLAGRM